MLRRVWEGHPADKPPDGEGPVGPSGAWRRAFDGQLVMKQLECVLPLLPAALARGKAL